MKKHVGENICRHLGKPSSKWFPQETLFRSLPIFSRPCLHGIHKYQNEKGLKKIRWKCVCSWCMLFMKSKKYYHFHLLPTKILHPRILQLFEFIQDVNKRTTEGCRGINYFAKVIWDIQYVSLSYSFRKHRHALCELSRVMFHKTKYCHCQRSFTNASNCGPWLHWLSWCLSSWVAVYDEVPVWVCIDDWIREFGFFRTNM